MSSHSAMPVCYERFLYIRQAGGCWLAVCAQCTAVRTGKRVDQRVSTIAIKLEDTGAIGGDVVSVACCVVCKVSCTGVLLHYG